MSTAPTNPAPTGALRRLGTRLADRFSGQYLTGVAALALLLMLSPLLAKGSLSGSALLAILPFAAILAVASAGQTLVVQLRGIDLSVAGAISLGAALFTRVAAEQGGISVFRAIAITLIACALAGALSGLAVTVFAVTPLVATLAMNGLLYGVVLTINDGGAAKPAPAGANEFALGRTAGIPNLVLIAVVVLVAIDVLTRLTPFGRRLVATGRSPEAAHVAGVATARYTVIVFGVAAVCYGLAGVMIALFLRTPSLFAGTDYLLLTVAAVVVGGTSLAGGSGSVLATSIGALFLTQLQQVVTALGAPPSGQLIVQGAVIAMAVLLRPLIARITDRRRSRPPADVNTGATEPAPGVMTKAS